MGAKMKITLWDLKRCGEGFGVGVEQVGCVAMFFILWLLLLFLLVSEACHKFRVLGL